MRNFDICKEIVGSIEKDEYDFIIANFSSPDMVGHTGDYHASVVSAQAGLCSDYSNVPYSHYKLNKSSIRGKGASLKIRNLNESVTVQTRYQLQINNGFGQRLYQQDFSVGFPIFLAHVNGLPEHERKPILKKMEQTRKFKEDMLTIESIKDKFGSEHTALIIKDEGKYMVKIGQDVQLYDDNTLPESMRGKLGMLKLVEAEHFISSVGCRINDEIFVVLTEET